MPPTNDAGGEVKSEFYARLQVFIDGVARNDLILLLGDFNGKVGSNKTGFEAVMEKHGLGEMSVNGELFADFCSFNKLVMTCYGRKRFPTQKGPQGDLGFSRQQNWEPD